MENKNNPPVSNLDANISNDGNDRLKILLMEYRNRSTNTESSVSKYQIFLSYYTPLKIEEELNKRIIGQEELTKSAADFLYYHALRQINPELPPRPMLISGPSGSGKTEVWRVAKKLFGEIFKIEVVDGASMTQDGWKGNNKLSSHIDEEISDGGILVIDEFDKLAKPSYESNGTNVAANMQAEFLKLLEGEYEKKNNANKAAMRAIPFYGAPSPYTSESDKTSTQKMGIVLVGAFEDIKTKRQSKVGFINHAKTTSSEATNNITDEEYIEFGVLPELIGRVAIKVTTNQLSDDEYIQIIYNPYSRVSTIINIFKEYGADLSNMVSEDEMRELIACSKSNRTGVRWVSSQIESKMLSTIRENGVDVVPIITKDIQKDTEEWNEKYLSDNDNGKRGAWMRDDFFC